MVDEHQDAIFRLAFLMLRHEDDAQDVTPGFLRLQNRTALILPSDAPLAANYSRNMRNQRRDLGRYWRALWRFSYQITRG